MASRLLARGAAFVLLATTLASTALAEPSASDKETARRLMAEGREKRNANDARAALQSFMAADAIMHVPTTGIEVARTLVALGQLVEARDAAVRVARSEPEKDEPAPFTRAREEARELSDDLARRVPTVTVQLQGLEPGASPTVSMDGAPLAAASLGAPRTVDPGHHVVVASVGARQGRAEIDVSEAQHKDVMIDLPGAPPAATEHAAQSPSRIGKPLFIAGAAVAGVGVVLGTVAGIVSLSKTSSVKSQCAGNACPASQSSAIESARSMATVSNVGFGVAAAGAIAGLVGYIMWKNEPAAEPKPAARVTPWIGPASAGLSGTF